MKRVFTMCLMLIGMIAFSTVSYSTDVISKTDYVVIKKEVSSNTVDLNQVEVVSSDHLMYRSCHAAVKGIIFTSKAELSKHANKVLKEDTKDHSPDILNSTFSYKFYSDRSSLTLYSKCVYRYPDYKSPILVPVNYRSQHKA